jgi:diguanylate cyclase (GGDEF)-like protein
MKKFFIGAILLIAMLPAVRADAPAPLTTLAEIRHLSKSDADKGLPVAFQATVVYYRANQNVLIVQDGDMGIFMNHARFDHFVPGDRVLIKGVTKFGFRPTVFPSEITLIGHGALPKPVPATFDNLIQAQYDGVLVTTSGVVRAANPDLPSADNASGATLRILTDGGYIDAEVASSSAVAIEDLIDSQVEVTAVAGERFDGKLQQTGVLLRISSFSDIKVVKPAAAGVWTVPETPMDQILSVSHLKDLSRRIRVSGVVTYYEPGTGVVLQNGPRSLWISTRSYAPIRIGDEADATGFPAFNDGLLSLATSEIRDSGVAAPVNPEPAKWQELASSQHVFDLVSIEGQVAIAERESAVDEYVLVSDGYEFSAIFRHPAIGGPASLAPMKEVPIGSRIRVTGICVVDNSTATGRNVHFNILLRSPDDIMVVAEPPWLNLRHLVELAGLLLLLALVGGARGWSLERKSRRDIGSLAYVEQRRGRILEEINSSEPLAEILERVTELVSVRLNGAPCWCQIADGALLGNRPERLASAGLRIVEHPIASRSGPPLGTIFAAFHNRTKPNIIERDALRMAAELATLAIETSRLHSDLVRRSEFDLLTDVQNRFALEKTLDALILHARQAAGIFGLVYIDLNEFKQVNDVHGHLVGDLYLQEVAQRMKRQLRPGDMLARLGGDEFAVLVPEVRNRAEVEEIAQRLENCFQEPFVGDGYVLQGSASIGLALYPEDANSADSLLNTADAAMYVAKYTRPRKDRPKAAEPHSELMHGNRK